MAAAMVVLPVIVLAGWNPSGHDGRRLVASGPVVREDPPTTVADAAPAALDTAVVAEDVVSTTVAPTSTTRVRPASPTTTARRLATAGAAAAAATTTTRRRMGTSGVASTTTTKPKAAKPSATTTTRAKTTGSSSTIAAKKLAAAAPALPSPFSPKHNDTGQASWYHAPDGTCASTVIPKGTLVKVTSLGSGKWTSCRVADYGPTDASRIIDLSYDTFERLAGAEVGLIQVKVEW